MKGRKHTKLVALLSSGTFITCDVFLVIISAKECQTDVLTKVGTILLCSFVFNGISHHRHFIFDFFFCTMYPCPDLLLEGVSKQWIKCKNYSKFCPMKDRRLGGWLVYNYDVTWDGFESSADWTIFSLGAPETGLTSYHSFRVWASADLLILHQIQYS